MYHYNVGLAAMMMLPALTLAGNTVKFINHCSHPFWFWAVGDGDRPAHHDPAGTMVPANGGSVIHPMENTWICGGGIALKIRDLPKYEVAPAGIMQVEYKFEPPNNVVWYDLSAVNCNIHAGPENPMFCPLLDGGFRLTVDHAPGDKCPPAWCKDRVCHNTYMYPGSWLGEPTFRCSTGSDIIVQTCTDGPTRRTFDHNPKAGVPHPAPPPHTGPLAVSPDQSCGAQSGFTCKGSPYGQCCSQYNFCGNTTEHCGNKCQSVFGNCHACKAPGKPSSIPKLSELNPPPSKPTSPPKPLEISPDGHCGADSGYTCAGSEKGDCCSSYGHCGTSNLYCGAGCQSEFGKCAHVVKREDETKSWMGLPVARPTEAPVWVGPDGKERPLDEVMRDWRA